MHCQFHNQSQSPRACTDNFTTNSLGHALLISQSAPISKGMHWQFHNKSLSLRPCTINFTINSLGHALSISQLVPISKGMHYQFHHQFPRTWHCQVHNQSLSPRACTINFTTNSIGHALSISQSVPISKGMHYQFHYQFPRTWHCQVHNQSLSPRACTDNFTISPYL